MNASGNVNREARWSILVSVLMILAGLVAIIIPEISGIAITFIVAWLMILMGAAHFVYMWHRRHRKGFWWGLLLGILYTGIGIFILEDPAAGLATLTLLLGIYLFVESMLEFSLAFFLRPHKGWGWLLFNGVVTLILALMIWLTWPKSALWVIGTLVGISMLFTGISRLMLSLAVHGAAKATGDGASAH
jgi:uncharacterized membrane protein HdeD (DUF308 family)